MTDNKSNAERGTEAIESIASRLDADVMLINSPFDRVDLDRRVRDLIRRQKSRPNIFFILVSEGGDAAAAFKVARHFQRAYKKITAFVPGWCKSAGTLCLIGAHELVIGDEGELGPLDVQLRQKDELGDANSGLVVSEALAELQKYAFGLFEDYMLQIKTRSQGGVSFKLATDIATRMTTGLLAPLYSQIDPLQIGDFGRHLKVAADYGIRLAAQSKNVTKEAVQLLVEQYPSHDFVIDRGEATEIFVNVREPLDDEQTLAECLGDQAYFPRQEPNQLVCYLSKSKNEESDDEHTEPQPASDEVDCDAEGGFRQEGNAGDPRGSEAA